MCRASQGSSSTQPRLLGAVPLRVDQVQHFWENEVHLREVPLAAPHVEEDQELDDLEHVLVLVEDDLLDGVEDHVLIVGNALRDAVDDGLEAIVEALDVLRTAVGAVSSDTRGHSSNA